LSRAAIEPDSGLLIAAALLRIVIPDRWPESIHMDSNEPRFRLTVVSSHSLIRMLMAAALWHVCAVESVAQIGFGRPNNRPTVSPYLNLFRNQNRGGLGNSTLLNYYGLVRPQNQAIEQSQQLNQGLHNLQQQTQQPNRSGHRGIPRYSRMGITGHPTAFMTIQPGAGGSAGIGSGGFGGAGFGAGGFGNVGGAGPGVGQSVTGSGSAGFGGTGDFGSSVPLGGFGGPGSITGHAAAFGTGIRGVGSGIGN
jgi:hypothetical protein